MGLKERKTKGLLILGHRGCRNDNVPENTIAAFQRAYDVGAEGIEIDVESTKDGQLLVVNRWFLKKNFDFFPWERNLDEIQSQGRERGILFPPFDEGCQFVKGRPGWISSSLTTPGPWWPFVPDGHSNRRRKRVCGIRPLI
jgi:glycerophosphoryl diester phosphodiesterase